MTKTAASSSTTRRAGGAVGGASVLPTPAGGRLRRSRVSDFLTKRELHRTWLYDNFFAPLDIEHELEVPIPRRSGTRRRFSSLAATVVATTERGPALLDLLQPHLARISLAARTRRLLSSALAELDRVDEHDPAE